MLNFLSQEASLYGLKRKRRLSFLKISRSANNKMSGQSWVLEDLTAGQGPDPKKGVKVTTRTPSAEEQKADMKARGLLNEEKVEEGGKEE